MPGDLQVPQVPQVPEDIQRMERNAKNKSRGALIFIVCVVFACLIAWAGIEINKAVQKSKESFITLPKYNKECESDKEEKFN